MSSLILRSVRPHAFAKRPIFILKVESLSVQQRYVSTANKQLPRNTASRTTKAVSVGTKTPPLHQRSVASSTESASPPYLAQKSAVNPPESTLPPPLNVPDREPGQGTAGYYYKVGKSYLGFYKTAIKAVWTNYRESKAIESRIPAKDSNGSPLSLASAARSGLITRSEFQFILRSRKDFMKLPLLGLLLAICGEWLPFIIIFFTGFVPRTAWIPKQTERARRKIETRRAESFRRGTLEDGNSLITIGKGKGLEGLTPSQTLHVSRALGLHSTFWETFWEAPPQWLARTKAQRATEHLSVDDKAIDRDGGVKDMSDEEVKIACEDRGIDVLKVDVAKLRKQLQQYLKWRIEKDIRVAAMALVRPSQWDQFGAARK